MKKLMAALLLAGACQTAFAAGIDIDNAWARTTVPGMSMGGVFMEIENEGKADDVLLGGSTPVAAGSSVPAADATSASIGRPSGVRPNSSQRTCAGQRAAKARQSRSTSS